MKRAIVPIFLILLLLLIGCSGGSQKTGPRDQDFETGTGSLDLAFQRNAPPKELFPEQESTIALLLESVGADPIKNGFVTFSYEKAVIEFNGPSTASFSMRGKSADFPKGDSKLLTFPFYTLPLATESQVRETTIVAQTCFDYRTEVKEQVCIETDPFDLRPDTEESVCNGRDLSPGGTGGPVRVNKVEPQFIPVNDMVQPKFTIEIAQASVGKDRIYAPGKGNAFCTSASFNNDVLNLVTVRVELSGRELECSKDIVELREGKATITCSAFPIDATFGNYEAPLYIELQYGVSKSISQNIAITR